MIGCEARSDRDGGRHVQHELEIGGDCRCYPGNPLGGSELDWSLAASHTATEGLAKCADQSKRTARIGWTPADRRGKETGAGYTESTGNPNGCAAAVRD